jgi:ADP-heptose:LPS heptosyltransferase
LISNLDFVITIDTGLAHLVGALNKPCLLLLDRYKTCWRWLLNRNDSPWYPSLTLIRQTQVDGYDEQLMTVQNHIAKKIGAEAPISSI